MQGRDAKSLAAFLKHKGGSTKPSRSTTSPPANKENIKATQEKQKKVKKSSSENSNAKVRILVIFGFH